MSFQITIARKFPLLRNTILRRLYHRQQLNFEEIRRSANGHYYLYKVDGTYFPNETLHDSVSYRHFLEKAKNESLHHYTPVAGDTVIDLGAGLGEEMVVLSKLVGPGGFVLSVEANPDAFNTLAEVIRRNGFENVMAVQFALAASDAPVHLQAAGGSYEAGFLSERSEHTREVPGITLDTLLKKFNVKNVDLLKSNIEGAERFITNTSPENMRRIRHVAIACHDFRMKNERNEFFRTRGLLLEFLQEHGFETSQRHTGIDYLDDWVYGTSKFSLI